MRIRISHETLYRYETPIAGAIQTLRLTPRNHDGQYVVHWRIEAAPEARLIAYEDAFGNATHTFTAEGPLTEIRIAIAGLVETSDTHGVIGGAIERFPPSLYLRETALTQPDNAIADYARATAGSSTDRIETLHALMSALANDIGFDLDPTHSATTAAEAFALKRGVCQDITHVFIACARVLGIPARYVGGYFHRTDGIVAQNAGHAWAEAFVPSLGWVGFDPTNRVCADERHVRTAIGLDYLGAAPVRGARFGGGGEDMTVAIEVDHAMRQSQS